jgi:nucleoside-diphosphate-sugar epimerase
MATRAPIAAVTGAGGYLGSRICETLEAEGWRVIRLARSPIRPDGGMLRYELAMPITQDVKDALRASDVLVHAAYDLALTSAADIWQVNVEGTRRLLEAARDAAVDRVIVLSSMSAFEGTTQLYGRAKLEIEAITAGFGGCIVRPGLVHGEEARGMAGALRKLTMLPIVPIISGGAEVYTVSEQDFMMVIALLASAPTLEAGTMSIAHPRRVTLTELLRTFAAQNHRRCRFVPVPWQPIYWLVRSGELLRLHLPFRADSLLALVHSAPGLVGEDRLAQLGVTVKAFPAGDSLAHSGAQQCGSFC